MKNLNVNTIVSSVMKEFKERLNESSRDNLLEPYLKLLQKKNPEMTLSQVKQYLLTKFVNEANIRSLSLDSNFYLAGVSRYYFEGKLTKNVRLNALYPRVKDVFDRDICQKLSALIVVLRNSYIDSVGTKFEQPEDFGTLSLEKLLKKYNKDILKELGIDIVKDTEKEKKDNLNRDENVGNGYTFEILYNYDEARKYNKYTEPGAWCITYGEHHYDAYVNRLHIHYVIFKKDGFEKIPRKQTEGWTSQKPQDAYGNSLIALLQSNTDGRPVYITSRWNHGTYSDGTSCEADHAYTDEEFMRITGVSRDDLQRIFKIWQTDRKEKEIKKDSVTDRKGLNKKRLEVLRVFKYAQMRINGGNFDNAFGDYDNKTVKYLTGTKKIESLAQKISELQQTGEDCGSFIKQERKAKLNSIRACELTINGDSYYYLIDGNKILFETITESDRYYRVPFSSPENNNGYYQCDAENHKNVVLCAVVNGFMIYDTRKHKFVEIEGKKKFNYISDIGYWAIKKDIPGICGFYEVKMSGSQMALVNLDTNEPLVLPNGHSWFEKLGNGYSWRRDVTCRYVSSEHNVLQIKYDTSSGEEYWYDILTKKFFNPKEQIGNNSNSSYFDIQLRKIFRNGFVSISSYMNNEVCVYSLFKDGKIVELDGAKFFTSINGNDEIDLIVCNKYMGVTKNNYGYNRMVYSRPFIYDTKEGVIYNSPESEIEYDYSTMGDSLIKFNWYNNNERNNEVVLFFNVNLKKWMINPKDQNSPFFRNIYKCNVTEGKIVILNENGEQEVFIASSTEPIFIPKNEDPNNIYEIKAMNDKNKKRIILTNKQLNEVLKEANLSVDTGKANGSNATNAYNQLTSADKAQEFQKLDSLTQGENGITVTSQGTDENMPTLSLTANTLSDAANQVMDNADTLNKGCDFDIKMQKESKSFSKKHIEEARLRKMRNEGVVMSKSELIKSFLKEDAGEVNRYGVQDNLNRNTLKEMNRQHIIYISNLGYEVRIDSDFGNIYASREEGGSSVSKISKFDFMKKQFGDKTIYDDLNTNYSIRNLDSNNIPKQLLVADDNLAKKIAYWIFAASKRKNGFGKWDFDFDKNLMKSKTWLTNELNEGKRKNKIKIDPKNKGKFTTTKKKTGKSTEELTHSKNPLTRKRAMFAKMAKRNWKPLKS